MSADPRKRAPSRGSGPDELPSAEGERRSPGPFEGLGPALRTLREAAGLTQVQVCQRSGISAQALSRYESGRKQPKLTTLDAVLAALDRDALDLALELYRQQAAGRWRSAREELDRPDLLASAAGAQIVDHARMLYFTGCFWIDAALALLPAARPDGKPAEPPPGPGKPDTETGNRRGAGRQDDAPPG